MYSRALIISEIQQNFDFGANTNLPPVVFAGGDRTENWGDYNWAAPESNKRSIALNGRVTNDRPEASNVIWKQVGGPTVGVKILNEKTAATSVEVTQKGRYAFRLTADDGTLTTSDEAVITVNCQPNVRIVSGPQKLAGPKVEASLEAQLLDSGLAVEPVDGSKPMTFKWSKTGSPPVQILNADKSSAKAPFTVKGLYPIKLEVDNGIKLEGSNDLLKATATFDITVNDMPVLRAADASPVVTLPANTLEIKGIVERTGLGDPKDTLSTRWTLAEGPVGGTVTFANATELTTTATFSKGGLYILLLTATNPDNPTLTTSVEVRAAINHAPVVDLSPVPTSVVLVPKPLSQPQNVVVTLDATVSDDGLPENPGKVTLRWSRVSGPSQSVTFVPDNADVVEARFTKVGVYVLQLEAFDGLVTTTGGVTTGSAGSGTTVKQVTVEVKAP